MLTTKHALRRCHYFLIALIITVGFGCTTVPPSETAIPRDGPVSRNADDLLIVDCLLPSQVRRLGLKFTYLTPQRPVRIPAGECAIRGGDYVSYDRANLATSLKVWLSSAEQGDAEAQTYVGEIFEKGLGQQADYVTAAAWYRRAAEQGYSRAQINLGYLYETGLGVEQDLAQAMNYYRQASGITDGELEYVSTAEYTRRAASKKLSEDTIAQLNEQVQQLTGLLDTKQSELQNDRRELQQLRNEVDEDRRSATSSDTTPAATSDAALIDKYKQQLDIARQEQSRLTLKIANQQKLTAAARKESGADQSLVDELTATLRRKENRITALLQQLDNNPDNKNKLSAELRQQENETASLRSELDSLDKNPTAAVNNNSALAEALENENRLKSELANRNTIIGKLQTQITALESDYLERVQLLNANIHSTQEEQQETEARLENVVADRDRLQSTLLSLQKQLKLTSAEHTLLKQKLARAQSSDGSRADVAPLQSQLYQSEQKLRNAQTEQRRLTTRLINKELTLARHRKNAGELEAVIKEREALVGSQQQHIKSLEVQLAEYQQQTEGSGAQSDTLAAALDESETALLIARQEQRILTDKLLDLKLSLSEQLQDAESRADRFASVAEERAAIVEQQRSEIDSMEQQLAQLNSTLATTSDTNERSQLTLQLERSEQAIDIARDEQKRLSEKLRQVQMAANRKLKQTEGKLSASEEQLIIKTRLLEKKEATVNKLETDVAALRVKLESNADTRYQTAVALGPTIEVIAPQQLVTRGKVTLQHPGSGNQVTITGKVSPEPDTELFSLNINGIPINYNSAGLFTYNHDLLSGDVISMIAVDNQAQRNSLELTVAPRPNRTTSNNTPAAIPDNRRYLKEARSADFGNYHALIIGNFDYQHRSPLKTVENDVLSIEKLLRTRYGYTTELLLNATRDELLFSLNRQYESLTSKDNLLIYYAGHGELDGNGNKGYWLPVDARPNDITNWISNEVITDIIGSIKARHVMVVADSCYSGTLTKTSIRGGLDFVEQQLTSEWFKLNASLKARVVMTSGGVKPVFDALGDSRNSVFAKALINELKGNSGALSGNQLFRAVQQKVEYEARLFNVQQSPEYSPIKNAGHEISEYFFIPTI